MAVRPGVVCIATLDLISHWPEVLSDAGYEVEVISGGASYDAFGWHGPWEFDTGIVRLHGHEIEIMPAPGPDPDTDHPLAGKPLIFIYYDPRKPPDSLIAPSALDAAKEVGRVFEAAGGELFLPPEQ